MSHVAPSGPAAFRFRGLILPILLAWLVSAGLRWSQYDERLVPVNIGASYHVLLTVEALDRTPPSTHHFLPIVTLGRALDRDVRFGASVRSADGIYYYTSFASLGFVAPWSFFKITGLAPNVRNLMAFNFLVHLAATLLLALLVAEIVAATGLDAAACRAITMLAALTYLFTFEARYSHGIVYWHHSLFQPVWLAQLIAAGRALRAIDRGEAPTRGQSVTLVVTALLGPLIEWTGYLSAAATAFVLWRRGRVAANARRSRFIAAGMIAAAAIAGVLFLAQYVSVVGIGPLLASLAERAGARTAVHISPLALLRGYVESFGWPFIGLVGFAIVARRFVFHRPIPVWATALLVTATLPLIENVILAEHAATYHFDRLKVLVTGIVALVACVMVFPRVWLERAMVAWSFVIAMMLLEPSTRRLGGTSPPVSSNARLVARVHSVARPCTVYGTDAVPRGWAETQIGGNVYEAIPDADSLNRIARGRGACQAIYLRSALDFGEAMYLWGSATVSDIATGHVDTIPGTPRRRPRLPPATTGTH